MGAVDIPKVSVMRKHGNPARKTTPGKQSHIVIPPAEPLGKREWMESRAERYEQWAKK